MRFFLFNVFQFLIILIISVSCEKEENPPIAKFSTIKVEKDRKVYVTFHDESINKANSWKWTISGYNSTQTSTEQNPTIVFDKEGKYDVTLVVSNDGGSDDVIKDDFLYISRFNSLMPADAIIQHEEENVILEAKSYCLIASFEGRGHDCHIETFGTDINGEQVGILIYWDLLLNFYMYESYTLGLSEDLVFFNVTNNSNSNFDYFIVNRGTEYESLEQFVIPNDGIKHGTGYYLANNNMEVRAYSQEGYAAWKDNDNFNIPWKDNQVVDLTTNQIKHEKSSLLINSKAYYPSINLKSKHTPEQKISENSVILTESGYRFKD